MTHTLLPQNNVWNSNCLHIKAANIFRIAPTINFSHFFGYTHLPAMEDHMTCWILQLTIQQEISPSLRFWANSHSKFKNLWKFPYIHMDLCACTSTLTHTHTYRRPKDLLCLALFIVFIIIWIAIGVYGEWTLVQFALRLLLYIPLNCLCTWRSAQTDCVTQTLALLDQIIS